MKKSVLLFIGLISLSIVTSCSPKENINGIAVFIPGVVAGSPTYEGLDNGVKKAAKENGLTVKTIEAGFNSAEWPQKLKELAATGLYSLIVSSNPSMPQIMDEVSKEFPNQKFLCLDGELKGNPNIYTAQYKQFDQAYMAGYMAGLVTLSKMEGANKEKKVGVIVAMHYPVLDNTILPGFKKGLSDVDPEITVDVRVVGNWWDAAKAKDLAALMIADGTDVFLSIAGGATQGVITQCQDSGKYIVHFDSNGFNKAPGTVVASTVLKQEELTYKLINDYINGKLKFGKSDTFSAKDGYIDFIEDDPLYIKSVPKDIREKMSLVVKKIKQ